MNILENVTFVDLVAGLFAFAILLYILLSEFFGHTVDPSWITIFLTLVGYLGIGGLAKQIPSAAQTKQINAAMTVIGTLTPPALIGSPTVGEQFLKKSCKTCDPDISPATGNR